MHGIISNMFDSWADPFIHLHGYVSHGLKVQNIPLFSNITAWVVSNNINKSSLH